MHASTDIHANSDGMFDDTCTDPSQNKQTNNEINKTKMSATSR